MTLFVQTNTSGTI